MELTPREQIKKIIKQSKEILLVAETKDNMDNIASLLGLHLFLDKFGKKNTAVSCDNQKTKDFLPGVSDLRTDLKGAKDFIISLDISRTKVDQFKYNIKDNKLNIHITPRNGYFQAHDVEMKKGKSKFDLIIALGAASLENLGEIYSQNAEIFYEAPIVNIDYRASNEKFGEINLIETAASSVAEIIYSLFADPEAPKIDQDIATCLLAGIIHATNSFQGASTTPSAFTVAAKLVEAGADREKIICGLYRTQSLSHLRLWGRTLARLKTGLRQRIAWSLISPLDFEKSKSKISDLDEIINAVKNNIAKAEIVFLLAEEKPASFYLKIKRARKNIDLDGLAKILIEKNFQAEKSGSNEAIAFIKKQGSLAELEKDALEAVKKILPA